MYKGCFLFSKGRANGKFLDCGRYRRRLGREDGLVRRSAHPNRRRAAALRGIREQLRQLRRRAAGKARSTAQEERPPHGSGPGDRHRLAGAVPLRRQLPAGGEPAVPLRPEPQAPDRRGDRPAHGHRQRRQPRRAGRVVRRPHRTCCTGSSAAAGAGPGSTRRARSAFPPSIGTATTGSSTTPTSRATPSRSTS